MANHVFISYNRADRAYARKLAEHLRGQGFEVWIDDHIEYGSEWPHAIRQAVRSCAAFTVVMTPDSEQSFWVGCEVDEARNRNKPIFPLLRGGEVFFGLNTIQFVDVTDGKMPGPDLTERLVAAGVPRSKPATAPAEQTAAAPLPRLAASAKSKTRPAWLWAVGVLCVLVVIISGALLGQWLAGRQSSSVSRTTPSPTATTHSARLPKEAEPTRPTATAVPTPAATTPVIATPVPTSPPSATPSPTATLTPVTGATRVREQDGAVMVYVPAGEFWMGSTEEEAAAALAECDGCRPDAFADELPQHKASVGAFWIDRTEVTNAQYRACVDAGVCSPIEPGSTWPPRHYNDPVYDAYPVADVTWDQAQVYGEWVGGRLPTEAEWEYAARGPEGRIYPWGESAPNENLVNYGREVSASVSVGLYPDGTSWCGALDMSGNVAEWTQSEYKDYPYDETDGREDMDGTVFRVLRGGDSNDLSWGVRCAYRDRRYPGDRTNWIGFRVVLEPSD